MNAARIIRACAWLVPAGRRDDWRRQWLADLAAQAAFLTSQGQNAGAVTRDLTRRSFGAFSHAVWLRAHHWRTLMTLQDLRYAYRGLRQRPGFTLAVMLTLGLAIGSTSTIYAWVDSLVFNALPGVPRTREIGLVRFASPTRNNLNLSYPNFKDIRTAAPAGVTGVAVSDMLATAMRVDGGTPERVWVEVASGNLFEVLEVGAHQGRVLQLDDELERRPVVVISHALWRTRFQSDRDVVGRSLTINNVPLTIIGVTAEGFQGTLSGLATEAWLPVTLHQQLTGRRVLDSRGSGWLQGITRVASGSTREQGEASLRVISDRLVADKLIDQRWRLRIGDLSEDGAGSILLPIVSVLMALVVLVLLIACANVSGLLLARAVTRQHELAVRAALGAGRARVIRLLLLESLLLASGGGLLGLVMTVWTSQGLQALLPPLPFPVHIVSGVNSRVLGFSIAVVGVATLLFGLLPALQGSRTRLQLAARGSRSATATSGRARLRSALVVAQVALALVLIVSAGLFVRTLANVRDVDPGFTRRQAVLASFDLTALGLPEDKGVALLDRLTTRLESLPGVERASVATFVPLSASGGSDTAPDIEGYTPAQGEEVTVYYGMVDDGYFETLGINLVAGRTFDGRDTATSGEVVIINETMARKYWNGRDPVGSRLRASQNWATVVGVARDGKYGQLSEAPRSVMYFPIQQTYRADPTLLVATRGDAAAVITDVRRVVSEVAPDVALFDVRTLEEHLRLSVAIPRMAALLLGIFGGMALLLSAIGLSGVIGFSVSQRTQEIGVRMALGADRGVIVRQVLWQGVVLAAIGLTLGLVGAVAATPLMASLLVNVSPADPLTFAATLVGLLVVALAATWIPARRAAALDPVKALRE